MAKLKIVNEFGNVDLSGGAILPKRYVHIAGKRLQPICRKLNINYAEAVVGWDGHRRYGYHPIKNGVVVSVAGATKLQEFIDMKNGVPAKVRDVDETWES